MIISHKYKFIFIKCGKTAGTSLEVFLSQHCGKKDVVTPIIPHVEPHYARNYEGGGFYNHISAREIKERISTDIWSNYFKFCIERNPWDKTLSHWQMMNYRAGGTLSFEEYLSQKKFCINLPKYTDQHGKIIVDKILRYEDLSNELTDLFTFLGIPFDGTLRVRAKSEYRKCRKPYKDVLNKIQKEIINAAFAKEIELLGYSY